MVMDAIKQALYDTAIVHSSPRCKYLVGVEQFRNARKTISKMPHKHSAGTWGVNRNLRRPYLEWNLEEIPGLLTKRNSKSQEML